MGKSFVALCLLVLLCSGAYAIQLDAPDTIVVQQAQKNVPIAITNDSFQEKDYSIYFSAPINATVSPSYGILPGEKATVSTLSIKPDESLAGSTYEASLEVRLGDERATRNVRIIFKAEETGEEGNGPGTAGLFSLAAASEFITGLFTIENAANVILVFVAAILLIAFIARFVKRLEEMK